MEIFNFLGPLPTLTFLKSNQYIVQCKVILRGKGCPGAQLNRDRELSNIVQPASRICSMLHYCKVSSSRLAYYQMFGTFWPRVTVHMHQISP